MRHVHRLGPKAGGEKVMFTDRNAEGTYKIKHTETRLGSTILPYTYTFTLTHRER